MIRIYDKNETDFTHNGLGILKDAIKCLPYEELNGGYTAKFEYPITGFLAEYLVNGNIIKAPCGHVSGNDQLFSICNVEEDLDRKKITVNHISYDLNDNMCEDVRPTNLNGNAAIDYILTNTKEAHNFTGFSDIETTNTAYYVMRNPIQALIGDEDNSFKNVWGGELVRDNFLIKMLQARGQDRGVKLRKGKNIKAIKWITDETGVVTRIYPKGFNGLTIPEKYIDSPLINEYRTIKSREIVFNDIQVDEANGITEEMAQNQLRDAVQKQYDAGIDKPKVTISIDFVELSKTEQYEELYTAFESIYLGDIVEAIIGNIHLTLKVIKTTYNSLLERYENFVIGDITNNYVESEISKINNIEKEVTTIPTSVLNKAKAEATDLITNSQGGYATKTQSEFMILDTGDPATAQKVSRWNNNGFGFAKDGINGTYETAITSDGNLVLDKATVGQLDGQYIKGGSVTADKIASEVLQQGGFNLLDNCVKQFGEKGWTGNFLNYTNTEIQINSLSKSALFFMNGTDNRTKQVPNGMYTYSFKYKKLVPLADCSVAINGQVIALDGEDWQEKQLTFEVKSNTIEITYTSDTDSSLWAVDILLIPGIVKQKWSANPNEIYEDGTEIGGGKARFYSNSSDIQLLVDNDSVGFQKISTSEMKTEFTDKGMSTDELLANKAIIAGCLIQRHDINGKRHTWFS